jgi:phosphatidate phosphatase APP1
MSGTPLAKLYDALYTAERARSAGVRRVRQALGLAQPPTVLSYRGFGTCQRVRVRGRVLEYRAIKPSSERRSFLDSAYASYQRYATRELGGRTVRVQWGDHSWTASSDEEGFVSIDVDPPLSAGGWYDVEFTLAGGSGPHRSSKGHAFVIDRRSEFGVISDLDDTVIVTNVTNLAKRAHALFLSEARTRLPFPGIARFYTALHEGKSGARLNPMFYVSSSPWNLYEHVNEFLELHDIPYGPILLRDWGLTRTGFAPNGKHDHKLSKIHEILELTAPLPFILIGDSGQRDPELYAQVVAHYGSRIRSIYIRNASPRAARSAELERLARDVEARGTEFLAIDDTVAAAKHAASRGWIRWDEVEEVAQDKQADLPPTEPGAKA